MKNMIKRTICAVACTAVAFTASVADLPMTQTEVVQAAEREPVQVGDNVYATLDDYGTLTISGTGEMWENNHNIDETYGDQNLFTPLDSEEPCAWFGLWKNDINKVVFEEGVASVGKNAFIVCSEVSDPAPHHDYPSGYFRWHENKIGVPSLTSVTFSSTINTICKGAFYKTAALKSVTIPGNVTTIEPYAFKDSALASVKLNEGVESIGEYAFAGTRLTGVNIPSTVKSIEANVFLKSTLSNVTINKGTKIIKKDAFQKVSAKIYSKDVVIMEGAFGTGSTFTCYKGSTADKYAKNHGISVKYISDKPAKAKKPAVSSKNKKLYITCKTMSGVDGYQIRYATNKSMKNADTEFGKKITIAGLKKGRKYYVQARAYKKDSNGKRVYGTWSDIVSVTIK